jgi:hypothetical protein
MVYSPSRRNALKTAAGAALGLAVGAPLLKPLLPYVLGQQGPNEIDCGMLKTVPTFTGAVDDSWHGDTTDYQAVGCSMGPEGNGCSMKGHLYTKFNEYTWFGIEIPTSPGQNSAITLELGFDTNNTGNEDTGVPGFYNLVLASSPSQQMYEEEYFEDSAGTKIYWDGTPFFKSFNRGTDYDWRFTADPWPQFNVKIRTEILRKYHDNINFHPVYVDTHGIMNWADGLYWAKLVYDEQILPEFGTTEALATVAIGGALLATRLIKDKKQFSRREFLRLTQKY